MRSEFHRHLKGLVVLEDAGIEQSIARVVQAIDIPLESPHQEIITHLVERERALSGVLDTGVVIVESSKLPRCSSELLIGIGVSPEGVSWRFSDGKQSLLWEERVYFVAVILHHEPSARLRGLRAVAAVLQPRSEFYRRLLNCTSLPDAVEIFRRFEEKSPWQD